MKTKPKIAKKNRPNPFLHMLLWGFGSGTILAASYYVFMAGLLEGVSSIGVLRILIEPLFWGVALIVGGVSGLVLGLVTGLLLWYLLRKQTMPVTRADMQSIAGLVYGGIGLTSILGAYLLIALFFGFLSTFIPTWIIYIPPFIAGIAAAYAAHRYLFRLRLWSEQHFGIQIEKAKNSARLEDKLKNEDIEIEDEAENSQKETS